MSFLLDKNDNTEKRLVYNSTAMKIFFSFFISLWLAVLFVIIYPISFENNDDPEIAAIAYGVNGEYDPHLIFENIIYGKILVALLNLFPTIPWYTVISSLLVFVSFASIIYIILSRFGFRNAWICLLPLVYYFGIQYYSKLQFSRESGIATLAGILLLFYSTEGEKRIPSLLLGCVLTIMGSLYRFEVFEMLLIPLFGIGLVKILPFLKAKKWNNVKRLLLTLIIPLGVCFLFKLYDYQVYNSDSAWRNYKEFDYYRAELYDRGFPEYSENVILYQELGFDKEDIDVFLRWNFDDTELFTTDSIKKIVAAKERNSINSEDIVTFFRAFIFRIKSFSFIKCLVIAVILCIIHIDRSTFLLMCYEGLALVSIEFYFFVSGRMGPAGTELLPRIEATAFFATSLILFLYGYKPKGNIKKSIAVILASLLLVGTFRLVYPFIGNNNVSNVSLFSNSKEGYEDMHDDIDHFYMYMTGGFYDFGDIWTARPLGWRSNSISLGGWKARTPTRIVNMDRYGIKNPFKDVVDDPSVYLVSLPNGNVDTVLGYIQRHYSPQAQAYRIRTMSDVYGVYFVSSTAPAPNLDNLVIANNQVVFNLQTCNQEEDGLHLFGRLYAVGEKTFDCMLFVEYRTSNDNNAFFVIPQTRCLADMDYEEGKYVYFDVTLENIDKEQLLAFYVESPSKTYKVDYHGR